MDGGELPKPVPGTKAEALDKIKKATELAVKYQQQESHYRDLGKEALEKVLYWQDIADKLPDVPAAETIVAERLAALKAEKAKEEEEKKTKTE
ncbi:Ff.00g018160.m01.CDS01 [Fusarium sp. VM40]|nr:Ff.00g018160.m01.CDS01 [Fusarium sp. VM40]